MKVVCDNCRAVYRVPDAKLTKAVNKATCRTCGHRMLIPRPKPGADPEERTLVTAVPPTPVGAPPRDGHTRPILDEEPESTLPGRKPDDLHVHTPMGAERHDYDGPSTVVSDMPPGHPATNYPSPRAQASNVPAPSPMVDAQSTTVVQAPPPEVRQQAVHRPSNEPRRTPMPAAPRRTPGPAPRRTPAMYSGAQPHDPSGDLNWAMFGAAGALLGAFLLAFLSVYNHPLLMWFGLAFSFGGSVLTFMVLLTGSRGRKPARTLLSVVLGFMAALVMSTSMVLTKMTAEVAIDALDIQFAKPPAAGGTTKPALPDPGTPVPVPVAADGGTEPNDGTTDAATDGGAEVPPEPAPAAPSPTSKPSPRPSPSPSPSPRPSPQSAPRPAPVPVPVPAAPQPNNNGQMVTVPTDVIHLILTNNIEVKKCFVPMYQARTLPPRVDLGFTILPAGNATKISLRSPTTLRGSELERCLQSAISRVSFPPTSGNGTVTVYPFILQ